MKAVWEHARAELIEAEDTIINGGKEKNKDGNGRVCVCGGGGEWEGEKLTKLSIL